MSGDVTRAERTFFAGSLGGFADLSWVIIGYLLAATIAAPPYGHLCDRFGRRRMLLGALAIITAASLACAPEPELGVMSLKRAALKEPWAINIPH